MVRITEVRSSRSFGDHLNVILSINSTLLVIDKNTKSDTNILELENVRI